MIQCKIFVIEHILKSQMPLFTGRKGLGGRWGVYRKQQTFAPYMQTTFQQTHHHLTGGHPRMKDQSSPRFCEHDDDP